MQRLVITANGNYSFQIPTGRDFSFAASGADFDSAVLTPQYNTGMTETAATGTLTVDGVVVHGETVTIDDDVYQFAADEAQTVDEGNIPVDITAVATASQGKLTIGEQVTAGDTMVIGLKTYTFVAAGTADADGKISVGSSEAVGKAAIVSALKNEDGLNTENTLVSCADDFVGDDLILTAKIAGAAGDLIPTTSDFTNVANLFDGVTLGTTTPGVDCVQADAVAALVAADAGTTYTLANGAGDTVDITASTTGPEGNTIATTTTMENGAFAAETLTGGTDPIDRWKPFATTSLALSAAGEKFGTNVGMHNEINLNVASKVGTTKEIVVVIGPRAVQERGR